MRFTETPLAGAYVIEPEPVRDDRGFFCRTHCRREFLARGLAPEFVQTSLSFNAKRGTLRGMHYQAEPHEEAKLVRVVRGAAYDVAVDLRAGSPTRCRWYGLELNDADRRALYLPAGFAHGFLTLTDETEVLYQISSYHAPAAARGVRWDDPAFKIEWPAAPEVISEQDRGYPDFRP
jgi:dTDP-4-dehydrorhamnose 3,5-epimerase